MKPHTKKQLHLGLVEATLAFVLLGGLAIGPKGTEGDILAEVRRLLWPGLMLGSLSAIGIVRIGSVFIRKDVLLLRSGTLLLLAWVVGALFVWSNLPRGGPPDESSIGRELASVLTFGFFHFLVLVIGQVAIRNMPSALRG